MSTEAISREAQLLEISPTTVEVPSHDLLWQAGIWWKRLLRLRLRPPRSLRLCESLPLGERRFVAVVEFERSRFLVGGTSTSMVLLAQLGQAGDQAASPTSDRNDSTQTSPGARR
jgi:flagellar biogenesis protein FliO